MTEVNPAAEEQNTEDCGKEPEKEMMEEEGEDEPLSPDMECPSLAGLVRGEPLCSVPGSLPVLLELRESSSEAGSSTQTPLSPEEPQEFFDTQESLEPWRSSPTPHAAPLPHPPGTPLEVGGAPPYVPEP